MISREEAFTLLLKHNPDKVIIEHSLETEAVLRELANKFGEDENLWGIVGLLHDLDFSTTKENFAAHGLKSKELLENLLPDFAINSIATHNYINNGHSPPSTKLDYALRCGESVTGLISANALVRPEKMVGMKPKSLKKKMKAKAFAANVDRDTIKECSFINLELNEFFQLSINAISKIADKVGLK
jgi:uncharacterized protein